MERSFKGVWIPSEVYLDGRLNALEKIILAEIDSLDVGEKGCFATNQYISSFCQCSERKVTEAISKLIRFGYIRQENFNGRSRILRSCLANSARQDSEKCEANTNIHYNKINIDIKNNYKKDAPRQKRQFVPPSIQEVREYCIGRGNGIDAEQFFDFYASKGWKVGNSPMKDWKAAVRTWERREKTDPKKLPAPNRDNSWMRKYE